MKRIATGGCLNVLNERFNCNARSKTVSIMALLDAHPTDNPAALKKCIEEHSYNKCPCGIRSGGPVEKFALPLFEAQFKEGAGQIMQGQTKTYEECLAFHTALFCESPIRGKRFELKSRKVVSDGLGTLLASIDTQAGALPITWKTRRSSPYEDGDLAIDYVILKNGTPHMGVQVKPCTVKGREDVLELNRTKHSKCMYPVAFHFYQSDGEFEDTSKLCEFCCSINN